jgi:hypothetical protein
MDIQKKGNVFGVNNLIHPVPSAKQQLNIQNLTDWHKLSAASLCQL